MKNVSVSGIGKAGLPLACVIADNGYRVIGVGRNREKVDRLNKGINPIPEETGLSKLLKKNITRNLTFSKNAADAARNTQIHIIIVPLFIKTNKKPDLSNLKDAAKQISLGLKKGDLVVLETTVPVGTTNKIIKPILEKYSKLMAGKDFYLAFSPERMMTGYAISRYKEVAKVVGGINAQSTKVCTAFYKSFCTTVIEVSSIEAAEMTKIAEGIYRDVNIGIANELLKVCENIDLNYWEILHASKTFACHLHEPGNVGGHCIPVYPWFLINSYDVPLIKAARLLNDQMVNYYANKAGKISKKGGKILVVGISFREKVKETAYTRSLPLIKLLQKKGYKVYAYDPLYSKKEIENFGLQYSEDFGKADCIILMNKYPELKNLLLRYRQKIIDIKNSIS